MSDSGPGPYCSDGNHCAQKEYITELKSILDFASKLEARRIKRIAELEAENEALKKDREHE
jgi:hypothetical protein